MSDNFNTLAGDRGPSQMRNDGSSQKSSDDHKIVTFYSYKGGVGRSMALANTALLLADRHHRDVVIVDWDLEAPGLHHFFGVACQQITSGVIDYFYRYKENIQNTKLPISVDTVGLSADALLTVRQYPSGGRVRLFAAGAQMDSSEYSRRVNEFDWDELYREWNGAQVIEFFRQQLKREAQIVLVDSRTGITDVGGICTLQLPDVVLLAFAFNEQNLNGIVSVAKDISGHNPALRELGRQPEIIILPTRKETSELERRKLWEERAAQALDSFVSTSSARRRYHDTLTYVQETAVPYVPYFSYGEELVVETRSSLELVHSYELLVENIIGRESEPERKTLTAVELTAVLDSHDRWLKSKGRDGKRADLALTNLEGLSLFRAELQSASIGESNLHRADLGEANLREANLRGSDLRRVNLSKAVLRGASLIESNLSDSDLSSANLEEAQLFRSDLKRSDLRGAKLGKSDLREADLRGTQLQGADFTGAQLVGTDLRDSVITDTQFAKANLQDANFMMTNVATQNLAGASLLGAKLPEQVSKFEALSEAEQVAEKCRKLLLVLLGVCGSELVFLFRTTDAALLTMPTVVALFWCLPIALFCLFLYVHLRIRQVWMKCAGLPSVFPDGRSLGEIVCSWFAVERSVAKEPKKGQPSRSFLQRLGSIFLSLHLIPPTLALFWARYLICRGFRGTALLSTVLAASVATAVLFMRINDPASQKAADRVIRKRTWIKALAAMGLTLGAGVFVLFALQKYPTVFQSASSAVTLSWPFADLRGRDVSTKPLHWNGTNEEVTFVRAARLSGRDLRFARASTAFLAKADLSYAHLVGADLWRADIREANLTEADLSEADLREANLRGSELFGCNLSHALMQKTYLRGVILDGSDLSGANLQGADLEYAEFEGVDMSRAVAVDADLRRARLSRVRLMGIDFQNANLTDSDLQGAGLDGARLNGATLQGANLTEAELYRTDLAGADLRFARFWGASFKEARMSGANIEGADLRTTSALELSEIRGAKNWQLALYDDDLIRRLNLPFDNNRRTAKSLGLDLQTPEIYRER